MVRRSAVLVALVFAFVTLVAATPASAQSTSDQRTYFTFSAPVALPGMTLPAGKYLFRVLDTGDRRVIEVSNADGTKVYKRLLTISAQRTDVPQEPEVRFMEAPANVAQPVRTWWYPGNNIGHEFIYPKEQARRIAAAAHEPVLTTHAQVPVEEMKVTELARVSPTGEEVPVEMPAAPPKGVVQTGTLEPAAPMMAKNVARLPKTASPLPLVGLIGLLSVSAAAALSFVRRRH